MSSRPWIPGVSCLVLLAACPPALDGETGEGEGEGEECTAIAPFDTCDPSVMDIDDVTLQLSGSRDGTPYTFSCRAGEASPTLTWCVGGGGDQVLAFDCDDGGDQSLSLVLEGDFNRVIDISRSRADFGVNSSVPLMIFRGPAVGDSVGFFSTQYANTTTIDAAFDPCTATLTLQFDGTYEAQPNQARVGTFTAAGTVTGSATLVLRKPTP